MGPNPTLPASAASLRELCKQEVTGVLRLRSIVADDLDLYYMGGQLISACGMGDDWMFGRLAFQAGLVELEALAAATDLAMEMALPDALVQASAISIEQLQELQGECFRENVVRAAVLPWDSADFAAEDAVFPPNMQLGFDTGAFLDRTEAWYGSVWPLLGMIDRGHDPRLARDDDGGGDDDARAIVSLLDTPTELSRVLARSPVVPFRTLAILADQISAGALTVDGRRLLGDELASVTGELEALGSREIDVDGDTIDTLPLEPVVAAESLSLEALGEISGDEQDEPVLEGRTDEGEIDYEHVDAGGHVKIYDVLDKVDLSHVEAFPDAGELAAPSADGLDDEESLEIAGAETTLEIEGSGEADFLSTLEPDEAEGADSGDFEVAAADEEELELGEDSEFEVGDDGELADDPVIDAAISGETPPIQLSGTEESIEMVFEVDDEEEDAPAPPLGEDPGPSLVEQLPAIGFEASDLEDFERRIGVFNRIFRVVFDTFARSIGADQTLARFDSFLRDDSLQFPALFTDMHVNDDGTLDAAGLVRNLAAHHPSSSDSFLHQGLYELIYVHLYDAKDVLAPDEEREMMDRIAAYEEELHRR